MFDTPDTLYDRAYRLQYRKHRLGEARRIYDEILRRWPQDKRAAHAAIQLYNITIHEQQRQGTGPATRHPNLPNRDLGDWLKKVAKANGSYINAKLPNVYATLEALSRFFYAKKHEWVVFCFFDEHFVCQYLWINKGPDRMSVSPKLSIDIMLRHARQQSIAHILCAHNHPVSRLDYGEQLTRSDAIDAFYAAKAANFGFSRQDSRSNEYFTLICGRHEIEFSDALFVAGSYKFYAAGGFGTNYDANKPYKPKMDPMAKALIWAAIMALLLASALVN